jgi:hypothetical protein
MRRFVLLNTAIAAFIVVTRVVPPRIEGFIFLGLAALFVLVPQIVMWLDTETNQRSARWWAGHGWGDDSSEAQERRVSVLLPALVIFFILYGIVRLSGR